MSRQDADRGHQRARELAALRADGLLAPDEEAWLADHLEYCDACSAVAAEYDAQHEMFADLRAFQPEPPRDLWARTSAAIDAERSRSAGWGGLPGGRRSRPASGMGVLAMPRTAPRLVLAPLAALVVVVMVVGFGLLNSSVFSPGGLAGPTPITLAAAADIQVITRDSAGNLQILSRSVDQVCPVGASTCGVQPTFAVTAVAGVGSSTSFEGAISPTGAQMVVVARDGGAEGVYIVPVPTRTTPSPSGPGGSPSSTGTVSSPASGALASSAAPSVVGSPEAGSASPGDSGSPASSSPVESPSPSASPTAVETTPAAPSSAAPSSEATPPTGTPTAAPGSTGDASGEPSLAPSAAASSPLPSAPATPAADTALRIATGVTVVGSPIYAPDGAHLAFAAMPSDGSTGPDIYTWAPGDQTAQRITSDHNSWLAAWTADGILASRVEDGAPSTVLLDPVTGAATPVGAPATWLPAVSPDGSTAVWWSGSVKLAPDGVTWVPDKGQLVMGAWPNTASGDAQVLAKGRLDGFAARWADDGSALAVWTDGQGNGRSGELSLYRVDAATHAADLANPMLDQAPANPDFSIRTGRLVWTTPSEDVAPQVVEVLAWSGDTIGRLQMQADGSGTVVP